MNLEQLLERINSASENASTPETVTVIGVKKDEDGKSVTIECVDMNYENQYDVQLFLQKYADKKWIDSAEQVESTNKALNELREGLNIDNLEDLISTTIDIYVNKNFKGTLYAPRFNPAKKFEEAHYKADFKATITNCYDNGTAIIFNVSPSDDLSIEKIFLVKRSYSVWNATLKKSIKKPADFMYRYSQLETEFDADFMSAETLSELIGREVNVKVYKNPDGKGFHGRISVPKSV